MIDKIIHDIVNVTQFETSNNSLSLLPNERNLRLGIKHPVHIHDGALHHSAAVVMATSVFARIVDVSNKENLDLRDVRFVPDTVQASMTIMFNLGKCRKELSKLNPAERLEFADVLLKTLEGSYDPFQKK